MGNPATNGDSPQSQNPCERTLLTDATANGHVHTSAGLGTCTAVHNSFDDWLQHPQSYVLDIVKKSAIARPGFGESQMIVRFPS